MDNDTLIESGGFIKLYRSMLKWEWYDDINVKVLFLHLLLKANYENKKWHGIEIQKGDCITSISQLSKETKLTSQQVRTCIKKLKQTGEVTSKITNKYTILHIEKYSFFQSYMQEDNKQNDKQVTSEQQANNKQITSGDEGDDVGGAHAGVLAHMLGHVDDLGSLFGELEGHLLDGLRGADHGEHAAVVVAVGLGVEEGAAGHALGHLHQGVVGGLILLLTAAEIGDTFHKFGHCTFPPNHNFRQVLLSGATIILYLS